MHKELSANTTKYVTENFSGQWIITASVSKCICKYRCASRAPQDPVKVASAVCRGTFSLLHCWCIHTQVNHVLLTLPSGAASIRTPPCYLKGWFPRFDPAGFWCACSVPDLMNWSPFLLTKSQLAPYPLHFLSLVVFISENYHPVGLFPGLLGHSSPFWTETVSALKKISLWICALILPEILAAPVCLVNQSIQTTPYYITIPQVMVRMCTLHE